MLFLNYILLFFIFSHLRQFYYPGQYESRAKELVTCLYREEESMEVIETSVRSGAD